MLMGLVKKTRFEIDKEALQLLRMEKQRKARQELVYLLRDETAKRLKSILDSEDEKNEKIKEHVSERLNDRECCWISEEGTEVCFSSESLSLNQYLCPHHTKLEQEKKDSRFSDFLVMQDNMVLA